jgi:ATP-dependent helicase HrpA
VGCKIRFEDQTSEKTLIKMVTDGMLLAELQNDPLLSEYNAIIIDEAHERSLNIDFLLGYLKGLLARRPDLKVIVTSATIDTEAFSRAFNDAPIVNVSGRMYPVDVVYSPIDADSEEAGEITYIDAAVQAARTALDEPGGGDVLIFMPSERDIRETADQLKAFFGNVAEIIPLFGRLSSADQQRVFAPLNRRKLVVATNIAETSLTIPGVRYVIDSGLARFSRYNPRTRTQRLPIEPISQSSANQRMGRSGRVRNGLCVRLYSEEDFAARPLYTQPEIQRANLAEVILRMKAWQLGDIETFPFLNPPSPTAIRGGYALLHELGALDAGQQLTPLGRELARLPIDPTLGRMLLQSREEHATRELLIIASGLGIQDPRERPAEQKETAVAAHRKFADPHSDFLTLLNIWSAVHEQFEKLPTQNQRRKFCRAHFLSYTRMREWQDLHAQLLESLEDLGAVRLNDSNAHYDAIHRSIGAGLLGHAATRTERNVFKGTGNRVLKVFPGSVLYERTPPQKLGKRAPAQAPPAPKPSASSQPEWIIAGEVVETSQVFARTVAGINPDWIADLGAHLCTRTHQNPGWDPKAGQVLADEIITFHGLEVRKRRVAYGNINPAEAAELFIKAALVEGALLPEVEPTKDSEQAVRSPSRPVAAQYPFLAHNHRVRQKIETWRTRTRRHDLPDLDAALFEFYSERLQNVSSVHELNRFLRGPKAQARLCATEADLIGDLELTYDAQSFPDTVHLAGQHVPVSYAYAPGHEQDGVTIKLGSGAALSLSPASVDWAVPGLREAQVQELLRGLPKALRRELMPLAPKAAEIARQLQPGSESLMEDLSRFILKHYGVQVPPSAWTAEALPQHLRPRVEILGHDQKPVYVGRDFHQARAKIKTVPAAPVGDPPEWSRLAERIERFGLTAWNFGDMPAQLTAPTKAGAVHGWPGLELADGQVNLRLFRSADAARSASLPAVHRLLELALQKDLAWLHKDLRALAGLAPLLSGLCSVEDLQTQAFENLKRYLLPHEPLPTLTEANFRAALETARRRLPGLPMQLTERLEPILKLRREILSQPGVCPAPASRTTGTLKDLSHPGAKAPAPANPNPIALELARLLPANFLQLVPNESLTDLGRYLKALLVRSERARLNPVKDRERMQRLAPYELAFQKLKAYPPRSERGRKLLEEFRWMLEEFRVSLFAQELGTAVSVSPKRLDHLISELQNSM